MGIGQGGKLEYQRFGRTSQSGETCRQDEGQQLVLRYVVAQRYCARLVFANGLEDLAEGRMNGALDQPEGGDENRQHDVVEVHVIGQVETEQVAAWHALQAVLAAGEGRLKVEEEHHLRQRQRHHCKVDALAAYGQAADHPAQCRSSAGAGQQAQQCRQLPDLQRVARDVARGAEEYGVPEGQQPGIAEQQVERAGEKREAQHLHHQHRIDEERGDQAESQ